MSNELPKSIDIVWTDIIEIAGSYYWIKLSCHPDKLTEAQRLNEYAVAERHGPFDSEDEAAHDTYRFLIETMAPPLPSVSGPIIQCFVELGGGVDDDDQTTQ